jgi:hypothetical protein
MSRKMMSGGGVFCWPNNSNALLPFVKVRYYGFHLQKPRNCSVRNGRMPVILPMGCKLKFGQKQPVGELPHTAVEILTHFDLSTGLTGHGVTNYHVLFPKLCTTRLHVMLHREREVSMALLIVSHSVLRSELFVRESVKIFSKSPIC